MKLALLTVTMVSPRDDKRGAYSSFRSTNCLPVAMSRTRVSPKLSQTTIHVPAGPKVADFTYPLKWLYVCISFPSRRSHCFRLNRSPSPSRDHELSIWGKRNCCDNSLASVNRTQEFSVRHIPDHDPTKVLAGGE